MKIRDIVETTTAGGMATVSAPLGRAKRRNNNKGGVYEAAPVTDETRAVAAANGKDHGERDMPRKRMYMDDELNDIFLKAYDEAESAVETWEVSFPKEHNTKPRRFIMNKGASQEEADHRATSVHSSASDPLMRKRSGWRLAPGVTVKKVGDGNLTRGDK